MTKGAQKITPAQAGRSLLVLDAADTVGGVTAPPRSP